MYFKSKFLIVIVSFYTLVSCAQSSDITDKMYQSYVAHKTNEAITIDGKANEKSWAKSKWSNAFIDIEGVETPTYKTQVKMMWDDTYFYILANIEEPHVWGDITKRDAVIFHNNDFEVFVDPDGDTHNYYELEINALNTAWDLFVSKPYRGGNITLNEWDIIGLKSAVSVNGTLNNPNDIDKGWVLEMAIPWAAYRTGYYQNNVPVDKFWRVNFSRVNWEHTITDGKYSRKKDDKGKYLHEYNWVWSPIGIISMHEPEKWGYVYFSSKEVGDNVDFIIPKDEEIKWELYKLYAAQRKYRSANGKWATSIKALAPEPIIIDGKTLNPTIENHSFGWNITVKSPFSEKLLILKEDGAFFKR